VGRSFQSAKTGRLESLPHKGGDSETLAPLGERVG
jgi:hypothetical protein